MNTRSSGLLAIALTLLAITAPSIRAQQAEQRQELEKKTLALLNDIASAAWSLKLPENRLFVMSSTAELLWTFDEKRARNLYWEVLNSLNQITRLRFAAQQNACRRLSVKKR